MTVTSVSQRAKALQDGQTIAVNATNQIAQARAVLNQASDALAALAASPSFVAAAADITAEASIDLQRQVQAAALVNLQSELANKMAVIAMVKAVWDAGLPIASSADLSGGLTTDVKNQLLAAFQAALG